MRFTLMLARLAISSAVALCVLTPVSSQAQNSQVPFPKIDGGSGDARFANFDPTAGCDAEIRANAQALYQLNVAGGSRNVPPPDPEGMRRQLLQYMGHWRNPSCAPDFVRAVGPRQAEIERNMANTRVVGASESSARGRAQHEMEMSGHRVALCQIQQIAKVVNEHCGGGRLPAPASAGTGATGSTGPGASAGERASVAPTPRPRQYANRDETPDLDQARGLLQKLVRDAQGRNNLEQDLQILPTYQAAQRAAQRAFQQEGELRKTKLHRNANDATQCLQVERTGTQVEWGIEGRFRIINRCDYQIEASWCANTAECTQGFGSTWKLNPGVDWPIYFSDPDRPFIRVGACRTEANRISLPSDAALRQPGAVNSRHNDPPAALGVARMQSHICE